MEKPALFIASSVEGLPVAEAINLNLDHDTQNTIWRSGTFLLGSDGLGDLVKKSSVVDFAVFVFTPDDLSRIRSQEHFVARDNVVFELGLFIGALGKDRCYVVRPRGVEMHLPSDLLGITTADYVPDRSDGDLSSALNAACKRIKDRIEELGSIPRREVASTGAIATTMANPPSYSLHPADLKFLAQCVQGHVSSPGGMAYGWIERNLKGEPDYIVALSAVKLMRLGYVEKLVEADRESEYFAYRATEAGLDAFLKYRDTYSLMHVPPVKTFGTRTSAGSGFDDMDDSVPF
jgi:hypothetical protein